jgi:hypothetical protein
VGPALRALGHGDPRAADVTASFEWSGDAGAPRPLGVGEGKQHYHLLRGPLEGHGPRLALVPGLEPWLATSATESTPRAPSAELPRVHAYVVLASDDCELPSRD